MQDLHSRPYPPTADFSMGKVAAPAAKGGSATGSIYTGADRRPPQPSQPQAVSPLPIILIQCNDAPPKARRLHPLIYTRER